MSALLICSGPVLALSANPTQQELEEWFNSDDAEVDPSINVNEGSLAFLQSAPEKPVHFHQNEAIVSADSLVTGWITLKQCHDNLDRVGSLQITYREGFVRDLRVDETRNIEKAWVEGPSVQLQNISAEARICITAETRAVRDAGNGVFEIANGPYMRRFLDGYYPMRVSMRVRYPATLLQVTSVTPAEQPGFNVEKARGEVAFEALFEGELRTTIQFQQIEASAALDSRSGLMAN